MREMARKMGGVRLDFMEGIVSSLTFNTGDFWKMNHDDTVLVADTYLEFSDLYSFKLFFG
jgi:hypothetical protein